MQSVFTCINYSLSSLKCVNPKLNLVKPFEPFRIRHPSIRFSSVLLDSGGAPYPRGPAFP